SAPSPAGVSVGPDASSSSPAITSSGMVIVAIGAPPGGPARTADGHYTARPGQSRRHSRFSARSRFRRLMPGVYVGRGAADGLKNDVTDVPIFWYSRSSRFGFGVWG